MKTELFGCLGVILLTAGLLVFGSVITFGLGYLGGIILQWMCGETVANGLNMVLGNITQYTFTPNDIPLFAAIMTLIGGFFKSSTTYKSKD